MCSAIMSSSWITPVNVRCVYSVTASGTSEYRINDKTVPFSRYSAALEEENILIKAKNFLVFQVRVKKEFRASTGVEFFSISRVT